MLLLHSPRTLRLTSPGRLLPWLGPALRGLVARRFKKLVCQFPLADDEATWPPCKGCVHMADCPYGQTLEADPPAPRAFSGQDDGTRPIVVAPYYPLPEHAKPGMAVPVVATFVGKASAQNASSFWEAVALAGRDAGLGDDRVRFDLESAGPDRFDRLDLPRHSDALSGTYEAARVELTSPLLLRRGASEGRSREMLYDPEFSDLLRAGLRTLGALARGFGEAIDADFATLKEASLRVPRITAEYQRFAQGKWSNRSKQHGAVQGVTGSAVFGPVPAALVAWLSAAGRVHVGLHRVAGAGGWVVAWTPDGGTTWEEVG